MKLKLREHLSEFGLITEMKDWYQKYQKGNPMAGIRPTDTEILDFVKSVLTDAYQGKKNAEQKVVSNNLAPWLIDTIISIGGVGNIGTTEATKFGKVVEWFLHEKSGGNIYKIKALNLDRASNYAISELERFKQEETEIEKRRKETNKTKETIYKTPNTQDEIEGKIRRIYDLPDGSGRFWVKVEDPSWFKECWKPNTTKGVNCQATGQIAGKYATYPYETYTLIGPPKSEPAGFLNTILSISIIDVHEEHPKAGWAIAEVRQEDNHFPGSQATSGGWADGDVWYAGFVAKNPEMKKVGYFGTDSGSLTNKATEIYGAAVSFAYMMKNQVNTFNKLAEARPDIIENNYGLITNVLGEDWFIKRNVDIDKMVVEKPIEFLNNIELYKKVFGDKVESALKKINYKEIAKKSPNLILEKITYILDYVSVDDFNKIIKSVDFDNFIKSNINVFTELIRKMSTSSKYSTENIVKLINEHIKTTTDALGGGGKGMVKFLELVSAPKLTKHMEQSRFDPKERVYFVTIFDEDGMPIGERELADQLSILPRKERKKIIQDNKEYIKSFYEGNEEDKEIAYWRLFTLEASDQQTAEEAKKSKEKLIPYYDKKHKENPTKYEFPGIIQYYMLLNRGQEDYGKQMFGAEQFTKKYINIYPMKLDDVEKYWKELVKFYMDKSQNKEEVQRLSQDINKSQQRGIAPAREKISYLNKEKAIQIYAGILAYINALTESGASKDLIENKLLNDFAPDKFFKKSDQTIATINIYLETLLKGEVSKNKIIDKIKSLKGDIVDMGNRGMTKMGEDMYNDFLKKYTSKTIEETRLRKHIQDLLQEKFEEKSTSDIKKKINFSGIILDEKSRKELLSFVEKYDIPENWETVADHMTINMGELEDKSLLNKKIKLRVFAFAMNDKVASVRVDSPIEHYEEFPHITIAINRKAGGTSKDSKNLKNWKLIGRPFYVSGRIEEVSN